MEEFCNRSTCGKSAHKEAAGQPREWRRFVAILLTPEPPRAGHSFTTGGVGAGAGEAGGGDAGGGGDSFLLFAMNAPPKRIAAAAPTAACVVGSLKSKALEAASIVAASTATTWAWRETGAAGPRTVGVRSSAGAKHGSRTTDIVRLRPALRQTDGGSGGFCARSFTGGGLIVSSRSCGKPALS